MATSSKSHPTVEKLETQMLETWSSVNNLQATQQVRDCLAGLCLSQAALLVWECLSAVFAAYVSSGREEFSESGQFQGLSEAFKLFTSWAQQASFQGRICYLWEDQCVKNLPVPLSTKYKM